MQIDRFNCMLLSSYTDNYRLNPRLNFLTFFSIVHLKFLPLDTWHALEKVLYTKITQQKLRNANVQSTKQMIKQSMALFTYSAHSLTHTRMLFKSRCQSRVITRELVGCMITSSLPALACQQWTIVSIIFSIQLSVTHSIIHLVSESVGHSFIHPLSFTHFDSRLTQQTQQNEIQLTDKLTSHFNVKLKFRNYAMRMCLSVWMNVCVRECVCECV